MYNPKDIQFVGKHDFDRDIIEGWNITFSVGIFQWILSADGKHMKKGKAKVRVSGLVIDKQRVFEVAESIVNDLDSGNWDGRKTVRLGLKLKQ